MSDFSCKAYGKWILAGEHAVLRGAPALVFPLKTRGLDLEYQRGENSLELSLQGEHGPDLQLLVWGVLEKACEMTGISRTDLKGSLLLRSSVPVGAGLGASASLCVALTRWLGYLDLVPEKDYYEFARRLENLFHGESSGVDIAVALSGQALRFLRQGDSQSLNMKWQPHWYISYSGKRGVTIDAVNKVKAQLQNHPEQAEQIDRDMIHAVELAEKALSLEAEEGFPLLVGAIAQAGACFEQWGLNEGEPAQHIQELRQAGAIAIKPTGSGGGGYMLSLWSQEPPVEILSRLIPCS